MKTQIESTPKIKVGKPEPLIILNAIVKMAIKSKSLKDLAKDLKAIDTFGYKYGFGSSHCWVKQIDNDKRILFITEE